MKNKWKFIVVVCFIAIMSLTILTPRIIAENAKCEKDGAKCEGECCKVTDLGCIAGPCSVIFPQ